MVTELFQKKLDEFWAACLFLGNGRLVFAKMILP